MKKNNIVLIVIAIVTLLTFIIGATYAYFATGNLNITNVVNANTITEQNNMVFDTLGGEMLLNVTASNMVEAKQGNVTAENNTTLTVNFTPNTDYSMVCTYDIIYEWTSDDRYTTHSSDTTDFEFGIMMELEPNTSITQGTNYTLPRGADLADLVGSQNSAVVVRGAQIGGIGTTTTTAVWNIHSAFINLNVDQSALSGKTYAGQFKIENVSCVSGEILTGYWFPMTLSTWNNNTGQYEPLYTHPNHSGTLLSSGKRFGLGHLVYIGQDESKYYTCILGIKSYSLVEEACLSQPYTQYGLEGHIAGNAFTPEQMASAERALYRAFNDAGFDIFDERDCNGRNDEIECFTQNYSCAIRSSGDIRCDDRSEDTGPSCYVTADGNAYCRNDYYG